MIISATVRTLSSDQGTGFEAWDSLQSPDCHHSTGRVTDRQGQQMDPDSAKWPDCRTLGLCYRQILVEVSRSELKAKEVSGTIKSF